MYNAELDEAWTEMKITGRTVSNLKCVNDITFMSESEAEQRILLIKVKQDHKKVGLKLSIQKTKIMASSPITSWQIDREMWKQWETLVSWAQKSLQMVTAALKLRHLLLGRKVMTNLDSILKSRDITLPRKVHLVKTLVFKLVMYGL